MVNDPGYQQGGGFKYGVNKEKAAIERERLFKIIEDLVQSLIDLFVQVGKMCSAVMVTCI